MTKLIKVLAFVASTAMALQCSMQCVMFAKTVERNLEAERVFDLVERLEKAEPWTTKFDVGQILGVKQWHYGSEMSDLSEVRATSDIKQVELRKDPLEAKLDKALLGVDLFLAKKPTICLSDVVSRYGQWSLKSPHPDHEVAYGYKRKNGGMLWFTVEPGKEQRLSSINVMTKHALEIQPSQNAHNLRKH